MAAATWAVAAASSPEEAMLPELIARRDAPLLCSELKSCNKPGAIKAVVQLEDGGAEFDGWANVADVLDGTRTFESEGDIVKFGAFKRTVKERGPRGNGIIKLFYEHSFLVGMPLELGEEKEGDRSGLKTKARVMPTSRGRDVALLLREKALRHMSVGLDVLAWEFEDREGMTVRIIKEARLWELSLVSFPANEQAEVTFGKFATHIADRLPAYLAVLASKQLTEQDRQALKAARSILDDCSKALAAIGTATSIPAEKDGAATSTPETEAVDPDIKAALAQLSDTLRGCRELALLGAPVARLSAAAGNH